MTSKRAIFAVLCLAGVLVQAYASSRTLSDEASVGKKHRHDDDKPRRCSDLSGRRDCLDGLKHEECAWCDSDALKVCLTPEAAYTIDAGLAECEGARPPKDAKCSEFRTKDDCLDGGKKDAADADATDEENKKRKKQQCAWCKGSAMTACLDADAASFITSDVAKCKGAALPDKPCGDLKQKETCLRGNKDGPCAWCKGGYMPTKCMDEQAAKFLPEFIAECKLGSDAMDDDDDNKDANVFKST